MLNANVCARVRDFMLEKKLTIKRIGWNEQERTSNERDTLCRCMCVCVCACAREKEHNEIENKNTIKP